MAYRLKSGESVPEGIKRAALEELESAAGLLEQASASNRAEAIHEARKSVKKTRAILRLMRPELDGVYPLENRRLHGVGLRLSEYRDAQAIIDIFDGIKEKYQGPLKGRTLASVRRALMKSKRDRERRPRFALTVKGAAASLRAAARRAANWPLRKEGFAALAPGLAEAYRKARKAMAAARKHSRPESCHEWRKRAKDHWYHIRLLEDLWTDVMRGYASSLEDLEGWLGDHHNLEVLRQRLASDRAGHGERADVDLCLDLIGEYQKELRKKALSLGERVYEARPRDFLSHMQHLWDSWQAQPKSLKEFEKKKRQASGAGMAPAGKP